MKQNKKEGWEEHIDLDLYRLGYPKEEIGEIISIYRSLLHNREEEMVRKISSIIEDLKAYIRTDKEIMIDGSMKTSHNVDFLAGKKEGKYYAYTEIYIKMKDIIALDEVINKIIKRK